jgi:hypothetical protein
MIDPKTVAVVKRKDPNAPVPHKTIEERMEERRLKKGRLITKPEDRTQRERIQKTVRKCVLLRYIVKDGDDAGLLIEQMRYMSALAILKQDETQYGTTYTLQFKAPRGFDTEVWARHNVQRMRTFGLTAGIADEGALDPSTADFLKQS